jgi:hypothetical protein
MPAVYERTLPRNVRKGAKPRSQGEKQGESMETNGQEFQQARKMMPWEMIREFFSATVDQSVKEDALKVWQGYWVIAYDEAVIRLPDSDELRAACGTTGQQGPEMLVSILYAVLNDLILDACIEPAINSTLPRAIHLDRAALLQDAPSNALLVFDKAHATEELAGELDEAGIKYLMRVGDGFNSACDLAGEGVDATCQVAGHTARIIKLRLPGKTGMETLITNLVDINPGKKAFKWLYQMRWPAGIEPGHDLVRSNLAISNFTGRTTNTVMQDFYAAMILAHILTVPSSGFMASDSARKARLREYVHEANTSLGAAAKRDLIVGLMLMIMNGDTEDRIQAQGAEVQDILRYFMPNGFGKNVPRNVRKSDKSSR